MVRVLVCRRCGNIQLRTGPPCQRCGKMPARGPVFRSGWQAFAGCCRSPCRIGRDLDIWVVFSGREDFAEYVAWGFPLASQIGCRKAAHISRSLPIQPSKSDPARCSPPGSFRVSSTDQVRSDRIRSSLVRLGWIDQFRLGRPRPTKPTQSRTPDKKHDQLGALLG